jgi:hypothetical protein
VEALYSLYVRIIKSRKTRWVGRGKIGNAGIILIGMPEGKRPLGILRHRWEDNIKIDFRKIGFDDADFCGFIKCR